MKEEKNQNQNPAQGGGELKTADGIEISETQKESLLMILGNCKTSRLESIGKKELVTRVTENFIKSNTKDDIDAFIRHHVVIGLSKLFTSIL